MGEENTGLVGGAERNRGAAGPPVPPGSLRNVNT